jgi:exodeoxyribonuclease VII large subunit
VTQPTFDFESGLEPEPEPLPEASGLEPATFSVLELNGLVRDALRHAFSAEVWVRGEVQNLKRSGAGHTYFTIVEKAGRGDRVVARLDVVLFRDDRRAVDRAIAEIPGAELCDDVDVRVRGRVTMYPASGRYQLVMTGIDPVFTVGGIAANRDRVLRALSADDLLDANGRRELSPVPLRVGLITSEDSAAYHDFVHELELSGYAWRVVAVDVRVQGSAAARRVKWALGQLAGLDLDAVVLVRGGGSRADLAPFDTELVARAVAAMPMPVITGVGHETDRSVVDEVAHTSCKTPTACAQTLVYRVREFLTALDDASQRVGARARRRSALATRELDEAVRRVQRGAPGGVARERARLVRRHDRIEELARRRVVDAARLLGSRERTLVTAASHHLSRASLRLDAAETAVRALDPRRVLERGYTITRDGAGRVVKHAAGAAPGSILETELADGRITSRVDHVTEDPQ